jgi:hypothetical protein
MVYGADVSFCGALHCNVAQGGYSMERWIMVLRPALFRI